jgi:hypothetical protein
MDLFITYDAKKALQNQEKNAINMSLEFTPQHEKNYTELSTSVAVTLSDMKGRDLGSNFVRLCAVEIKLLHGWSVPWASLKKEKLSAPAGDGSVTASPTTTGRHWQPRNPSISACRSIV